ncbi:hypothetical protein L210DRAFT_3536166 [Boletus edulis BED1]|uniref:Uncharacterized protein n=1 Tax=Boletus edulis BED1 TaxID=1328754 RepID=A0AAD4GFQ5_BOLED|nr:hypothetical protein L210DRAFT_3536166 [Boletus edulis BED1]
MLQNEKSSKRMVTAGRFLGLLSKAMVMKVKMISRANNTRSVPRMSLDRLYIAHTRSVVTRSAAPRKKGKVHPLMI